MPQEKHKTRIKLFSFEKEDEGLFPNSNRVEPKSNGLGLFKN